MSSTRGHTPLLADRVLNETGEPQQVGFRARVSPRGGRPRPSPACRAVGLPASASPELSLVSTPAVLASAPPHRGVLVRYL